MNITNKIRISYCFYTVPYLATKEIFLPIVLKSCEKFTCFSLKRLLTAIKVISVKDMSRSVSTKQFLFNLINNALVFIKRY